jgi:hypothetical protein
MAPTPFCEKDPAQVLNLYNQFSQWSRVDSAPRQVKLLSLVETPVKVQPVPVRPIRLSPLVSSSHELPTAQFVSFLSGIIHIILKFFII